MVSLGAKNIQNEDDVQGNPRPLPGRYHAIVKHVDESMEKFDKVIVEFEVLAGTTPGQDGRVVSEFFAVTEKAVPRLQRLAIVLGLLRPGEAERDVSFVDGENRQLVIEVEENKYTNKDGKEVNSVRVGYLGFWSLNNKAVDDVPKDAVALKLLDGGDRIPAGAATAATAAPAKSGGDGDDKWADL